MSRELGWGKTHWGGNGCFLTISLYFGFNQISVWKKDKNGEKPKGLNHRNGKKFTFNILTKACPDGLGHHHNILNPSQNTKAGNKDQMLTFLWG